MSTLVLCAPDEEQQGEIFSESIKETSEKTYDPNASEEFEPDPAQIDEKNEINSPDSDNNDIGLPSDVDEPNEENQENLDNANDQDQDEKQSSHTTEPKPETIILEADINDKNAEFNLEHDEEIKRIIHDGRIIKIKFTSNPKNKEENEKSKEILKQFYKNIHKIFKKDSKDEEQKAEKEKEQNTKSQKQNDVQSQFHQKNFSRHYLDNLSPSFKNSLHIASQLRKNEHKILEAINLLEQLALKNISSAANELGEIYFRNEYSFLSQHESSNLTHTSLSKAFHYFTQSEALGNPFAQHNLAIMYSSGLTPFSSRRDSSKSILYDHIASLDETCIGSLLSLGYRYMYGYSVPKSCASSIRYYQKVAEAVVHTNSKTSSMPPINMIRLSQDSTGGTSLSEEADIVNFLRDNANGGDAFSQVQMGRLYFHGARGVREDFHEAFKYFSLAANQENVHAITQLAYMHLSGYGTDQNNRTALKLFKLALSKSEDPAAYNGLAYMFLHGIEVVQDNKIALEYFERAASGGYADAQQHLGNMYYEGLASSNGKDLAKAVEYYSMAGSNGHTYALYNLAQIYLVGGTGVVQSCRMALKLFKIVAERSRQTSSRMENAYQSYVRGDYQQSLLLYVSLAEEGFEIAQHNAAQLFEKKLGYNSENNIDFALRYYILSADQSNVDSQRHIGDLYFQNLVSTSTLNFYLNTHLPSTLPLSLSGSALVDFMSNAYSKSDQRRSRIAKVLVRSSDQSLDSHFFLASRHYRLASILKDSQASFNLGFMHHFGIGVPRDFDIAKRYYDTSLQQNQHAYAPVKIALAFLSLSQWFESAEDFSFIGVVYCVKNCFEQMRRFGILFQLRIFSQFNENVLLLVAISGLICVVLYRLRTRRRFQM